MFTRAAHSALCHSPFVRSDTRLPFPVSVAAAAVEFEFVLGVGIVVFAVAAKV